MPTLFSFTVLRQSKKSQDDAARIREKEAIKTLKSEMLEKQSKKKVKQKSFRYRFNSKYLLYNIMQ